MHIHYFQHDHFEDLGYIADWAKEHNFTTSVTRFDKQPILPLFGDFDWLVVLGGKMGVYETGEFPWILREIEFIRQAIEQNKTVIGICLGSQLIASSLGAKVFKNKEPEMGFWPVQFTSEARKDEVFSWFTDELLVMHMHSDTFEVPEGAVIMASSAVSPCQAFRFGKKVFAFQFHFEVSLYNLEEFTRETEPELKAARFTQTRNEMLALAECCVNNNLIFSHVLDKIAALG